MAKKTETILFELPSYWACAFMYGDVDHLSSEEQSAIELFMEDLWARFGSVHCVGVFEHGCDFKRYHDASNYFPYASNVAHYQFEVTRR